MVDSRAVQIRKARQSIERAESQLERLTADDPKRATLARRLANLRSALSTIRRYAVDASKESLS